MSVASPNLGGPTLVLGGLFGWLGSDTLIKPFGARKREHPSNCEKERSRYSISPEEDKSRYAAAFESDRSCPSKMIEEILADQ